MNNTTKRYFLPLVVFMAAAIFGISAPNASAQTADTSKPKTKSASRAKLTMDEARAIALREESGKIESEELEKEQGKLVYSFDIRNSKGTITEIWVDAKTGAIVHKSEEDAAAEAQEKAADMRSGKKGKSEKGERQNKQRERNERREKADDDNNRR